MAIFARTVSTEVEVDVEISDDELKGLLSLDDICDFIREHHWFSNDWDLLQRAINDAKKYI